MLVRVGRVPHPFVGSEPRFQLPFAGLWTTVGNGQNRKSTSRRRRLVGKRDAGGSFQAFGFFR